MTRSTESRFRRLLAWYPKSWRQSRGDALVGILLDVADSEHRIHPTVRERLSAVVHGLEARLDNIAARNIRDHAATAAFSVGVGFAFVTFLVSSWAPWGNPLFPTASYTKLGPFYDAGPALTIFWGLALACLLFGRWRLGKIALLLSIVAAVAMPYVTAAAHPPLLSLDTTSEVFFIASALIAMLGTPQRNPVAAGIAVTSGALTWFGYSAPQPFRLPAPQGADVLWSHHIYDIWYVVVALLLCSVVLAAARRWADAFALVLALVPISTIFVVYPFRTPFQAEASALAVVVPEAIALAALILHSSGHLTLPPPRGDGTASNPVSSLSGVERSGSNDVDTESPEAIAPVNARAVPTAIRLGAATIATIACAALIASSVISLPAIQRSAAPPSHRAAPTEAEFAPTISVPKLHPGQMIDIQPDQHSWELELELLATQHHASSIAVDTTTGQILSVTDLGSPTVGTLVPLGSRQ
jgi:hypothetical protein